MSVVNLDSILPEPLKVSLGGKEYNLPRDLPTARVLEIVRLLQKVSTMGSEASQGDTFDLSKEMEVIAAVTDAAAGMLAALCPDPVKEKQELADRLTLGQSIKVLELVLQGAGQTKTKGAVGGNPTKPPPAIKRRAVSKSNKK